MPIVCCTNVKTYVVLKTVCPLCNISLLNDIPGHDVVQPPGLAEHVKVDPRKPLIAAPHSIGGHTVKSPLAIQLFEHGPARVATAGIGLSTTGANDALVDLQVRVQLQIGS